MKLAIRYWRRRRGLTQQEFATRIGKSRPMIPAYETGRVRVSSTLLYAMAKALDVSVEQLYNAEEDPTGARFPPLTQ